MKKSNLTTNIKIDPNEITERKILYNLIDFAMTDKKRKTKSEFIEKLQSISKQYDTL
jgi:DNA-binding protein YbaB